jgi:glycosyltransferase involved in cell wall biosynthesis
MTPRVTVLVPVYRGADIVGGAIESVLAQTYEEFELLLVDDCSPDDSVSVIEVFDDPRIRLLRNEQNLGQIGSLNRGLREARGEYIARLDQDDRCLPTRLQRQVEVLDSEPTVALVGGWMTIVDDRGNRMGVLEGELNDYVEFVFEILTNQLKLGHPAVTFRREPVLELGGYDESIALAEDKDLWRRLALAGHEARIVTEPLVVYLVHGAQQSQQSADLQRENNNRALECFVGAVSERAPARAVRLLLSWDERFWDECRTREDGLRAVAGLEALLADAAARLHLGPEQAAKLDRLIRARVALAARRSWRSSVRAHWAASPPLFRFGRSGGAGYALVYATAPLLKLLYLLKRLVMGAVSAPGRFRRLKRLGRRSPRLVSLYSRLRG